LTIIIIFLLTFITVNAAPTPNGTTASWQRLPNLMIYPTGKKIITSTLHQNIFLGINTVTPFHTCARLILKTPIRIVILHPLAKLITRTSIMRMML
jgi:hypothetical protein